MYNYQVTIKFVGGYDITFPCTAKNRGEAISKARFWRRNINYLKHNKIEAITAKRV